MFFFLAEPGMSHLKTGGKCSFSDQNIRFSDLFLACVLVFSFLVLLSFTGGLQKTKCFATIPRVEV